ncbi:MAG TPA: hypothetical protein HPP94_07740 [Desulfuromonadales bacterium]|nr:hypothetical protein [Desulfuromonadales bacterium]
MNDQQKLEQGLSQVASLFATCTPDKQRQISDLLDLYRAEKDALAAVIQAVDAADICRKCAGQCCQNGKFRLTVCDALALHVKQMLLSSDFNQKPLCPYGTERGCCLSPRFRPMDCILFVCDEIEARLTESDRFELSEREARIRKYLQRLSQLAGTPLSTPLLLWSGSKRRS